MQLIIVIRIQTSKLLKDEQKALKEIQSDTFIVILPADKSRSTVIVHCEDCFRNFMDHINNSPYQLPKSTEIFKKMNLCEWLLRNAVCTPPKSWEGLSFSKNPHGGI